MPPDYPYSIHLTSPDSTYYFDSYEAVCHFLDTTHLMSAKMKSGTLRDIEAARHPVKPGDEYEDEGFANSVFILFVLMGLFLSYVIAIRINRDNEAERRSSETEIESGAHQHFIYKGSELDFNSVTLEIICLKYNSFFRALQKPEKKTFLERLLHFMQHKQFWMYGEDCYKEMPVLLSATAMQLCFGLQDFTLDNYPIIVIRPQAYLGYEPLRILTGNVQGNTITVSWEHFLKDHLDAADGNNVGLHEMAHAFAMQLLYNPSRKYQQASRLLHSFYKKLEAFITTENQNATSLFDAYSLQNTDECWAKCIELFFERGSEMQHYYTELHNGVKGILNQ